MRQLTPLEDALFPSVSYCFSPTYISHSFSLPLSVILGCLRIFSFIKIRSDSYRMLSLKCLIEVPYSIYCSDRNIAMDKLQPELGIIQVKYNIIVIFKYSVCPTLPSKSLYTLHTTQ